MMTNSFFRTGPVSELADALAHELRRAYEIERPLAASAPTPAGIPASGLSMHQLPVLWRQIVDQSAHLGSPWMSGHMDTAPHPAAALTQALVAALNNNLLFRELSPFASQVEEQLTDFFIERLELTGEWRGLFASGGSLANLTALFAAVGGFAPKVERQHVYMLIPDSGHISLSRAAAVLGIPSSNIRRIACDIGGRMELAAIQGALTGLPAGALPIVVSVLGSTIHGSVDAIAEISSLCERFGAWHHVDAIYGAALAVSTENRHFLNGLARAHSIVLGPQKWMYVPRVSALCLIRGETEFNDRLSMALPYSLGAARHRGTWGLQGSRPADAVVLWTVLQVVGTDALGAVIDNSVRLTKSFHSALEQSELLKPTHKPDLNVQTFGVGEKDLSGQRLRAIQDHLTSRGRTWMSVSRWNSETLMRTVLLSPSLEPDHLNAFIADVEQAARATGNEK